MILNNFKITLLLLFLIGVRGNSQNKNANDLFTNHAMGRKVNNAISFLDISRTILLNGYDKSFIYILVSPNHSNAFAISLKNELPLIDKRLLKCFKFSDKRFIVFVDKSNENYGQEELYRKHFTINEKETISCDELFKQLKANKLPKIPENIFTYSIFEGSFAYLEDLATFDALDYLQIEYDLHTVQK